MNNQVAPAAKPPLMTGGAVAAIVPRDIEQAFRLAQAVTAAGFAPKAYLIDAKDPVRGYDQNKILVGILHGMEVGLTPMAALQSIAVVNGMPTIWGDGALGLVRASGLMEDFHEDFEGDDIAVCTIRRKGQASPIIRTFSRADATKAQLINKAGPWQTYPKRMLQMRARSWALRDGFADVLRGLNIREEVEDTAQSLQQGKDGVYLPTPARPTRAQFEQPPEPEKEEDPDFDPWLISPETFPSLPKFSVEWARNLSDVCETAADVDSLVAANTTRLEAWAAEPSSQAAVGALQADADTRRAILKEAA